jgi:hypothetical protein
VQRTLGSHYIEVDGVPVEAPDFPPFLAWMMEHEDTRVVARDEVEGGYLSTVFVGFNTAIFAKAPEVYESMAFDDKGHIRLQFCHTTRAEAQEGHAKLLTALKLVGLPPLDPEDEAESDD